MRLKRPSLRTKLAATVLVAFVVMVATGVTNIYVAARAREAVETTRRNHALVAAYNRLGYKAARVESEAWETIFSGEERPSSAEVKARADFYAVLAQTRSRAAALGPAHVAANAEIVALAPAMMAGYDGIDEFAAYLDQGDFLRGTPEFAARTNEVFEPHEDFRDAVGREVARGDAAIGAAAERGARLTRHLTFAGAASLLVGLLITSFLLVLILKRLRGGLDRLERGARAFGRGDLACRVALGGEDELASVSHAFDAMAQELSEKQRALEAAKTGLQDAVAARTAELEAANAALAAEDGRRRRFLADVSHELRTPLTIIRGEAQVALRAAERGSLDPAAPFGRILEQTQGMGRLVDDLFLIARAEAGGLTLDRRDLDLRQCAARVAADFEALAAERGASVRAAPGAPAHAHADPDRLRQMLAALVDNALRHTPPGVRIVLDAHEGPGWAEVSVEDDGPGLPPGLAADAAELFGRFARGETRGDGTGLGLAVVRALAEAHGGSARLERGEAGGVRAVVRLPASERPPGVVGEPGLHDVADGARPPRRARAA